MSFADNLTYIRQYYGVTQESLAEQLGVSRQTISKWEAGINYPETDKLLMLCDLYHTNLDDLMRGSVKITHKKDTELYDAHMNRFSIGISCIAPLVLTGVALLLFLEGRGTPSNISAAAMLSFIVVAALVGVVSGMNHSEFKRKNMNIDPSYPSEVLDRFGKRFTLMIAGGVGLLSINIILLVAFAPEEGDVAMVFGAPFPYEFIMVPFMLIMALGVWLLVFAGMQKSKFDRSEISYLTEDGTIVRSRKNPTWESLQPQNITPEDLRREHIVGSLCGAIMIAATIVFFVLGFSGGAPDGVESLKEWPIAGFGYSWIAFVVGGLLCAIVAVLGDAFTKSKAALVAEAQRENPWIKIKDAEEPRTDK